MKKNAWYDETILPNQMINGANGKLGWPKLENSNHFKFLDNALKKCENAKSIIDLGCGAGEVGRVYSKFDYKGYDLPHIIEKVSKVVNPKLNYDFFDANQSDFEFCEEADIVLSNGFITELESCSKVFTKVLKKIRKYFILHRQKFADQEELNEYQTYGGLTTTNCSISQKVFYENIKDKFIILSEDIYENNLKTILLKKI